MYFTASVWVAPLLTMKTSPLYPTPRLLSGLQACCTRLLLLVMLCSQCLGPFPHASKYHNSIFSKEGGILLSLGLVFNHPTAAGTVMKCTVGDFAVICHSTIRSGYATGIALRQDLASFVLWKIVCEKKRCMYPSSRTRARASSVELVGARCTASLSCLTRVT
jgi:hypothetical protein